MLSTLPEHRRRGLASLCVLSLSRRLTSLGLTPYLYVDRGNSAASSLYRSLGFQETRKVLAIMYEPKGE